MKKAIVLVMIIIFVLVFSLASAQTVKRLGDMPKSEYSISLYQVEGFHKNIEGYKVMYRKIDGHIGFLFLPKELIDKFEIHRPYENTQQLNFLVIWRDKNKRISRVQWYMPTKIDYNNPAYLFKSFSEKDKEIFNAIVEHGSIVFDIEEIMGVEPIIKAPGSE